ncbi:nitrile hydratase accessory protein [Azorhizobium oxalatiphilum]|uniref:Nitrile hydratase accessory protein n=1 Tax=Azorhizobium oxalatiphilum TaxID=980631 RepID=A0A917C023_9HYPH|nr:nitrile hydratase accessory protein [Azorhizobium oxalatiphilum]GGF61481.1 nitrile hydratase accessory protein [Azorhizobium oxalatiphilum]
MNPSPETVSPEALEPVFAAPWEAQAFGLVVALHRKGLFDWPEWTRTLAEEAAKGSGAADYAAWLAALERLVVARDVTTAQALNDWREAWDAAAKATPHGKPIEVQAPPAFG